MRPILVVVLGLALAPRAVAHPTSDLPAEQPSAAARAAENREAEARRAKQKCADIDAFLSKAGASDKSRSKMIQERHALECPGVAPDVSDPGRDERRKRPAPAADQPDARPKKARADDEKKAPAERPAHPER